MDDKVKITLTRGEMKELIEEAVEDAFTKMGLDTSQPLEMQRDFQHLRDWRLATNSLRDKGMLTILVTLITGGAAALWLGIRTLLQQ